MTSPVLSEIQRQQLIAIATAEDQLAAQTAAALDYQPSRPLQSCAEFVLWCQAKKLRYQPARPSTVAAYVLDRRAAGVGFDALLNHLQGIASLHDGAIGNPCATGIVAAALDRIAPAETIKPPRSWRKEEQFEFRLLPLEIQRVIARREDERDRQLLRTMNRSKHAPKEERKKEDDTKASTEAQSAA